MIIYEQPRRCNRNFSLIDRNFFQSGIFLPSMTWNTFVWAITLVRRSLSADLIDLSLPDFDPSLTTYIRDSMALVQCMDAKNHRTFGNLVTYYCRQLTSCFAKAHTVADVFDRGQTETARVTYTVIVLENSQTMVCCEGYDALTNSFHTIGCGNTQSSIR
jgi:GTPase SAR1 family protein